MEIDLPPKRITVIPFIHGKITVDGKLSEPDIYYIMRKWMERHPEFQGREPEFRISRMGWRLPNGWETELIRVTADFGPELAKYDPLQDADLYDYFVADEMGDER